MQQHPPRRAKPRKARKPPSLSTSERDRLRNRIMLLTPSEPWTQHLYTAVLSAEVAYKTQQAKELERVFVWPPGGRDATLMRHCRRCGTAKWIPPQYLNAGLCADCRENLRAPKEKKEFSTTTVSPSAVAIAEAEDRGAIIIELPLESEDTGYLKLQIERYINGARHRRITFDKAKPEDRKPENS